MPSAHTGYCTVIATRKASTSHVDGPPGDTWSSTTPTRATAVRVAMKPPVLTMPEALPMRVGGLKVRATSKPIIEPGPPTAMSTTRTTSSHSGARPGQSSTTVHAAIAAATIQSTRVLRENGKRMVKVPMTGLKTTDVTTISISMMLAVDDGSPCPATRNGKPHSIVNMLAANCDVKCDQSPSRVPGTS